MSVLSLDSAELKIFVYSGGTKQATPNYTLTKSILSGESTINFEISELIKDYVEVTFDGDYSKAVTTKFVETELIRTFKGTVGGETVTVSDPSPLSRKFIAFRGYGHSYDINTYNTPTNIYFNTHINPTLSRDILISNRTIFVPRGEALNVPFFTDEGGVHQVDFLDGTTTTTTTVVGGNVSDITADKGDVRADNGTGASQVFTTDMTLLRSEGSKDSNKITSTTSVTTSVKYTNKLGANRSIPVVEIEECKFNPYKVTFLNGFGALQDLYFFKKRTDNFAVEREEYMKSILKNSTTISGVEFSPTEHQSSLLDITATPTFTMNTGFVTEDHNKVIKELMLTEFCWITDGEVHPIKPITSSVTEKSELNDKLLNFEIEFASAQYYIQNVR